MKMNVHSTAPALLIVAGLFVSSTMNAQQSPAAHNQFVEHAEHRIAVAQDLQWQSGPDSLPPGVQYAVLEGDPGKPGVFTVRFKLPPNYRIPPHTHPKVERVTVLEGEIKLGMGKRYDEAAMKRLPAGSFFTMPPGMEHFAGTDKGAVLQLTGVGPWGIQYLNPSDDPRKSGR